MTTETVIGRLVLDDRVASGRITIEEGLIRDVHIDGEDPGGGPFIAPGFVDVHVHGWGGHDAMGGSAALDGMARALLRRGVTSFLPTAVTAPLDDLAAFADAVREWMPSGSTWKARSWRLPDAVRTQRRTCSAPPTPRARCWNRSSTGSGC